VSRPSERIIDFDDRAEKVRHVSKVGALSGKWRVSYRPYKPTRSLKANAFWWAAVIPAFQQFMRQHGQYFEPEEVHEFFLAKFASRNVIDPKTGEVLSVVGKRSSKMDTTQFSEFVNTCIEWMEERFGIVVSQPDESPAHALNGAPAD
jgi:hypothetical protein